VILRSVPPPPLFLASGGGPVVECAGLADAGTGGAGFNGMDTSSRTADDVVASSTGWPICGRSLLAAAAVASRGAAGAGRVGVLEEAVVVSLARANGLMLNPL